MDDAVGAVEGARRRRAASVVSQRAKDAPTAATIRSACRGHVEPDDLGAVGDEPLADRPADEAARARHGDARSGQLH